MWNDILCKVQGFYQRERLGAGRTARDNNFLLLKNLLFSFQVQLFTKNSDFSVRKIDDQYKKY